jgi:hypothetical protein
MSKEKQPVKKEITLTPQFEGIILKHLHDIDQIKKQMNRDLLILFDLRGVTLPKNFNFKVKDGKLLYSES